MATQNNKRQSTQQVNNAKSKRAKITAAKKKAKELGEKKVKAEKQRRNPNVDRSAKDPKRKGPKSAQKPDRVQALTQELKALYEITIRSKNDDFIIDSITNVRVNEISKWPALRVQLARVISALPTKIKTAEPLRSEAETVNAFIDTQIDPVLGIRYRALLKAKFSEVFEGFDYEGLLSEINDPDRVKMITNGSASPQLLAPPITGAHSNISMLCAMAIGRDIYKSDFNVSDVLNAAADGKFITVPKNYKTGRGITIAPRHLVDFQQVASVAFRDFITLRSRREDVSHIIQFDDQTVQHNLLIAGNATIDLSSASDRIFRSLLEDVWPEFYHTFEHLLPKDVSTPDGRIVKLTCVGTQGFPLTFTLMAIVCGLIVEAVKFSDKPSSNYGDDIIVPEEDFDEVYVALEALGLVVNKSKTHKSSNGFLESCGRDIMFLRGEARDITPVYLRGTQDVDIIQFFYQLCKARLIEAKDATSIMTRLNVDYFAFDYEFQLTEFHFPFGDVLNVPRAVWSHDNSQYICKVPCLDEEVEGIRGLSKKESTFVLELLHLEAGLKNPKNSEKYVRGSDPIARQYGLMDLRDDKLYELYRNLDNAEDQVSIIFYEELEREFNTTFKALMYYRFITSEMRRYKYSTPTVDFSSFDAVQPTLQEFIESEFGINSVVKYPIYRYKTKKSTKIITHPKSNQILGV